VPPIICDVISSVFEAAIGLQIKPVYDEIMIENQKQREKVDIEFLRKTPIKDCLALKFTAC